MFYMNVFSWKIHLFFLIVLSYLTLLSQSIEITKDNCKNNRTILSECSFQISFQPPLMETLECSLTFPSKTNYSVRFSSESFVLQRQVDHMCPQFNVEIWTHEKKPKRLFTTCGGTVNSVLKTFYNFTSGHILNDNKDLTDNSTIIKMQLRLETGKPCDDLKSKTSDVKIDLYWIIILSAVGFLVLIIVCVMIVYRYRFKGNERKAPNSLSPEVKKPLCVSVDGGNDKGRDLEDDRNGQGSLVSIGN